MGALSKYSNTELLELPDCEGLRENGKCRWLREPCLGEKCQWLSQIDSLQRAYARLRSLDEEQQERIASKYYYGVRPWMEAARPRR